MAEGRRCGSLPHQYTHLQYLALMSSSSFACAQFIFQVISTLPFVCWVAGMQRRLVAVILCVAVFVLRVEGSVLSDALSAAFVDVGADGISS